MKLVFQLSEPQEAFLRLPPSRYKAFIGGVGSGKTWIGAVWTFLKTQQKPGLTGLVGGLTYPMLRDVILPVWEKVAPEVFWTMDRVGMIAQMKNGSKVLFRSLESERQIDRIRGLTINWAWVDEGPYLPEYAWEVIQGRLREGEDQEAILTGTPRGLNWVYHRWGLKQNPDYQAVMGVSSDSNPFLDPGYYKSLLEGYTGEYLKQEFYGQFIRFQGLVYLEFNEPVHVISRSRVEQLVSGWSLADGTRMEGVQEWRYCYDSGFQNPRVLLQLARTGNPLAPVWVVCREFYQKQSRLSDAIPIFQDMMQDRKGPVYADPSAKGEAEEMKKAGLEVHPGYNEVSSGIQTIKGLLSQNRLLVSESCPMTIAEFNSYRWEETGLKDKPVKEMDHSLDALRYGLCSKTSRPGIVWRSLDGF